MRSTAESYRVRHPERPLGLRPQALTKRPPPGGRFAFRTRDGVGIQSDSRPPTPLHAMSDDETLRSHHRVHRPRMPVGVERRAVPAPARLALRGRGSSGSRGWSSSPTRRRAGGERASPPRSSARRLRPDRRRAPHADRHARAPLRRRQPRRLPRGGRRPRPRRPGHDADAAARPAGPQLRRRDARRPGDDRRGVRRGAAIGDEIEAWLADREVERGARARRRRRPPARCPAARVLDHKLANWSGGRPLHLPELRDHPARRRRDDLRPRLPALRRLRRDPRQPRPRPRSPRPARAPPREVLAWRATPLATQEVAVVCDVPFDAAREELGRVATQDCVGADGFWRLEDEAMSRGRAVAIALGLGAAAAGGRGVPAQLHHGRQRPRRAATEVKIIDPDETVKVSPQRPRRARCRRPRSSSTGLPRADLDPRQPRAPRPRLLGLPAQGLPRADPGHLRARRRAR